MSFSKGKKKVTLKILSKKLQKKKPKKNFFDKKREIFSSDHWIVLISQTLLFVFPP